jgi:S1-C subfamily serine protease
MLSLQQKSAPKGSDAAVLLGSLGMIVVTGSRGPDAKGQVAVAGVTVLVVVPGSAAHRAGVKAGDLIFEVDGAPVATGGDLDVALALHDPALPLRILFRREGTLRFLALWPERPVTAPCWE